jgi:hypothetical protein
MKIWFDTEFYENGRTIELISIGAVCENGSQFYAEVEEFDWAGADPWLVANVKPYLSSQTLPRAMIAECFLNFVQTNTSAPEFWAYYADYDWVVLCQLFGRMMDLPKSFPMFCRDVKQEMARLGVLASPIENVLEHNALEDAKWTMKTHLWLETLKQ